MSAAKTTKERKVLEAKWRSGIGLARKGQKYQADAALFKELMIETPKAVAATTVLCSFCRTPVEASHATIGTVLNRGVVTFNVVETTDGREVDERLRLLPDKVVACPDCSLKVRQAKLPRVD